MVRNRSHHARMTVDRIALRRFTQWLPFLVLVAICVAWWSPLGVVVALAACLAVGGVLQRLDLVGDTVGGALLRSRATLPFATRPPTHDVLLDWGELGMGGPAYSTQMLRDGAIVEGVSTGGSHDASGEWQTLAGSGLRVASGYVDRSEAVIVYDEADKRVMHLQAIVPSLFWQELHERRQLGGMPKPQCGCGISPVDRPRCGPAGVYGWNRSIPRWPPGCRRHCGMSCRMPGCCRPYRCCPTICA